LNATVALVQSAPEVKTANKTTEERSSGKDVCDHNEHGTRLRIIEERWMRRQSGWLEERAALMRRCEKLEREVALQQADGT
jgi:hypothetical protein